MEPRVSIGMPVYNGEKYLRQALDSILAQTFKDFELIISDNASTDGTQAICLDYSAQDARIRYYCCEKNLGAADNFGRVFELSYGRYFKWAAYDDVIAPKFLEQCVDILDRKTSVVLCYPRTTIIDEITNTVRKYTDGFCLSSPKPHERYKRYHELGRERTECHPIFGLIRADILSLTPLIRKYPSSDLILLGELSLYGEFYEIPEFLFIKRIHSQTSMKKNRSFRSRSTWFAIENKGKLLLVRWIMLFDYLRATCSKASSNET